MKKQRSILVTGGANGIGEAIAKNYLEEGDAVAILDLDKKGCKKFELWALKHGFQDRAIAINADVSDLTAHHQIISLAEKTHGPISVLVNNTGIGTSKNVFATEPSDFDAVLHTNIRGPFFLSQTISRGMRRGNCIVFVTSVHQDKPLGDPVYAMSKAALKMLIREFALSVAKKGIRVNGVAPGAIRNHRSIPSRFSHVPLGECRGKTNYIAKAVSFMTSPNAIYITGEILTVDGGLSLVNWSNQREDQPAIIPLS